MSRNARIVILSVILVAGILVLLGRQSNFRSSGGLNILNGTYENAEDRNTLQGTPHKGNEPPYLQDGSQEKQEPGKGAYPSKVSSVEPSTKALAQNTESSKTQATATPVSSGQKGSSSSGSTENIELAEKPKDKCDQHQYVVMIDAGSTGSRVHIYKFATCKAQPELLDEKFKMLNPGLSSFDTDTKGAATSLDPLLKLALETVPETLHNCTPVAVKATAGLRKLGNEKSKAILDEVQGHLENDYPFPIVPNEGVSVMDGREEGVYAWVTTNFLLGNIGSGEKMPTAAVFDLGGGSTQIVFEPTLDSKTPMPEGEHVYVFRFGPHQYTLYQYSHLGYGLMEGRNKINSRIVQENLHKNTKLAESKFTSLDQAKGQLATVNLTNPCIPPGKSASNVKVEVKNDEIYMVNMDGPPTTTPAHCRFLAESTLNKEVECANKPCSFNGIYQPSLTRAFHDAADMYVFSYFYDRTSPLGFPSSFTLDELKQLTNLVCSGDNLWKYIFFDEHLKALNEETQWCLDLSFITALLHTGYSIPLNRELKTAKVIDNNELGWCLGASLPLLNKESSGWKCKA